MKKSFLLFTLVLSATLLIAQNNKRVLNFDGIDQLKLGMNKAELEKLLGKKIILKHIWIDEIYTETVEVTYKGIKFELMLMRSYEDTARLESVTTGSPLYKTAEGIGIGSDQNSIINTYENHLLIITGDWITLANIDDIRSSIVFTMKNKKVVQISVEPTAAFRDRE